MKRFKFPNLKNRWNLSVFGLIFAMIFFASTVASADYSPVGEKFIAQENPGITSAVVLLSRGGTAHERIVKSTTIGEEMFVALNDESTGKKISLDTFAVNYNLSAQTKNTLVFTVKGSGTPLKFPIVNGFVTSL